MTARNVSWWSLCDSIEFKYPDAFRPLVADHNDQGWKRWMGQTPITLQRGRVGKGGCEGKGERGWGVRGRQAGKRQMGITPLFCIFPYLPHHCSKTTKDNSVRSQNRCVFVFRLICHVDKSTVSSKENRDKSCACMCICPQFCFSCMPLAFGFNGMWTCRRVTFCLSL